MHNLQSINQISQSVSQSITVYVSNTSRPIVQLDQKCCADINDILASSITI